MDSLINLLVKAVKDAPVMFLLATMAGLLVLIVMEQIGQRRQRRRMKP